MPSQEPCKDSFIRSIQACSPSSGGVWRDNINWIFASDSACLWTPSSPIMAAILKAWASFRSSLKRVPPFSKEEIQWQPLMWNDSILDDLGRPLGKSFYMQWSGWKRRPASTMGSWMSFMELSEERKSQVVSHLRGRARRIQQIERAIHRD